MDNSPRSAHARWLKDRRGPETQEHLAADISAVTGWSIDRSRYSKYESGSLPIGPTVLGHFIEYWRSRGEPGPGAEPQPEPEPTLASALSDLAGELAAVRREREAWQRGVAEVLRAYEQGRVPRELLDALVPRPLEDARP